MDQVDNSIALKVKPPSLQEAFAPISTMLDMRNKAQAFQQGNVQLQQSQMDLQERNALRDLSSKLGDYKTQDGNLDLPRLINDAAQKAPKLGMVWAADVAKAHAEGVVVNAALNTLSEQQRGAIGKVVMSVSNQPFSEQEKAINAVVQGNPQLKVWGDMAIKRLKSVDGQPNAQQLVQQIANATMSVGEQQAPSYVSTGGELKQTNPAAITAPQSLPVTLSPGARETIEEDAAGNKHVVSRSPQGSILSTRPVPGSTDAGGTPVKGGFVTMRPGQKADIATAQSEVAQVRQAGDQAPTQRNINQQILKLSADTKTGPGTAQWQSALGSVAAVFGGNASNYQELGKYLEKNAISNMTAMGGPPSDARLSAAAAANGSTTFNPNALQDVTKFNDATNSALVKYRQGVDSAVGLKNSDYTNLAGFKSAWAKNLDINIFRVENAIRDGDQDELKKISSELGPKGLKALATKRRNLESLSATGRLP